MCRDDMKKFENTLEGVSPSEKKRALVNFLRHHRMDSVEVNVKDNVEYIQIYTSIMRGIATDHPSLAGEVERQVAKKKRWQTRRQGSAEGTQR